jgi:hypothetical protein
VGANRHDVAVDTGAQRLIVRVTRGGKTRANVLLQAIRFTEDGQILMHRARTDAAGDALFPALTSGEWIIHMDTPGVVRRRVTLSADQPERSIVIELPAGEIAGVVRDAAGRPLATGGVVVRPMAAFSASGADEAVASRLLTSFSQDTSEDGSFVFGGLAEGLYAVTAAADGGATATRLNVEVRGGRVEINFALAAAARLVVTVIDHEGRPVPNAQIRMLTADGGRPYADGELLSWARTDAAGVWTSSRFAGEWTIDVASALHPRRALPVTLAPSDTPHKVTVALERGWEVRVRVRGSDGTAATGVTVALLRDGMLVRDGVTTASGVVLLAGVGEGSYAIRVTLASGAVTTFQAQQVGGVGGGEIDLTMP